MTTLLVVGLKTQQSSFSHNTNNVYFSSVHRANGRVLSAEYDSNRQSTNLGQIESVRRPVGLPPAYSTIDKPVFNVQEEIKTSHLTGNSIK